MASKPKETEIAMKIAVAQRDFLASTVTELLHRMSGWEMVAGYSSAERSLGKLQLETNAISARLREIERSIRGGTDGDAGSS